MIQTELYDIDTTNKVMKADIDEELKLCYETIFNLRKEIERLKYDNLCKESRIEELQKSEEAPNLNRAQAYNILKDNQEMLRTIRSQAKMIDVLSEQNRILNSKLGL